MAGILRFRPTQSWDRTNRIRLATEIWPEPLDHRIENFGGSIFLS